MAVFFRQIIQKKKKTEPFLVYCMLQFGSHKDIIYNK